jgi:hypothetical protein
MLCEIFVPCRFYAFFSRWMTPAVGLGCFWHTFVADSLMM